ncbi:MAG: FliG C-terminal domain-containing protein [Bacteriovoracaceae bacterium]
MSDNKKGLMQGFKRMFPGGVKAAVEMLQRLPIPMRDKILSDIEKKDPRIHEYLKNNLVTFPDLIYLTPQMMRELLREVALEDLGLALRGSSPNVVEHFLTNMSENNGKDLSDILRGKPRTLNDVQAAQEKIMLVVTKKIAEGKIVLSREGSEKLV